MLYTKENTKCSGCDRCNRCSWKQWDLQTCWAT